MTGRITSIQVGKPQNYGDPNSNDPTTKPWKTGIYKKPISGPVWASRMGLEGDGQADLSCHGGLDMAVLAYSAEHFENWCADLEVAGPPTSSGEGFDLLCGSFGENLTIEGITEIDVCIGDTWRAGDALLEVSQPRQPCGKLARRWGVPDMVKRVVQAGRSGWYLRVIEEGNITAGDEFELSNRLNSEWTIARANEVYYGKDRQQKTELSGLMELSAAWTRNLLD